MLSGLSHQSAAFRVPSTMPVAPSRKRSHQTFERMMTIVTRNLNREMQPAPKRLLTEENLKVQYAKDRTAAPQQRVVPVSKTFMFPKPKAHSATQFTLSPTTSNLQAITSTAPHSSAHKYISGQRQQQRVKGLPGPPLPVSPPNR